MKENIYKGIFIALFLAMAIVPVAGMMIFGPSEAAANEQLAEKPALKEETGAYNSAYLSDLAAWVNDRFFLRQELITADNYLSANLLRTSGAENVIAGKQGWLYYEPTLPDYTGTNQMTERQLYCAAKNLSLMARYCRENGKDFVFTIAPNKNSVYPQFMPDYGVKAEQTNASRLLQKLETMDVDTADLFAAFAAQEEVLYFAHDSHWNSKGAALGADVINAAFGVDSSYFTADFSRQQPHAGDLYAMIYPALQDPENDLLYSGVLPYTFTGNGKRPDSITIKTAGAGQGRLLAYRDSFGNLLFPYLADSSAEATFSRSTTYDLTQEADRILVELVERNLSYLIKNPPLMPSPVCDVTSSANIAGTAVFQSSDKRVPEGTVKITGTLPIPADTESSIYVICGGVAYEAFCLDENGYCAYVPADTQPEKLVFTNGGIPRTYEFLQNQ